MSRIITTIGVLLLIGLTLTACSGDGDRANAANVEQPQSGENAAPAGEPALPLNQSGEQIVATVNSEDISLSEFERTFDRTQQKSDAASYDALASAVLNTLIEQSLINQAAAEMEITVSDEEVEAEFQQSRELAGNDESWRNWLAENLFTEAEFRQSLHDALVTERLRDRITDTETTMIDQVHARHILVSTQEEANQVIARLNAGEDFATLTAALSNDVTTREQGGDLGWFTRDGLLAPELAEVAFQLEPGEIAGPVETMLGYHVIQTLDTGQRPPTPEERFEIAARQFTEWLQSRLAAANIERYASF